MPHVRVICPSSVPLMTNVNGRSKPPTANVCEVPETTTCNIPLAPEGLSCYCPAPMPGYIYHGVSVQRKMGNTCKAVFSKCTLPQAGVVESVCTCPLAESRGPDVGTVVANPMQAF
jgi:hypothetical protein